MLRKSASLIAAIVLLCSIATSSVMAIDQPTAQTRVNASDPLPSDKDAGSRDQLRVAVARMVAETKSGEHPLTEHHQMRPTQSNSLSRGKKIALGVGIAAIVIAVVVVVHESQHLGDFR